MVVIAASRPEDDQAFVRRIRMTYMDKAGREMQLQVGTSGW